MPSQTSVNRQNLYLQEEELDELAGQVSMLESTKLRLEMSLESLRKEHRREMSQREDELDEVRSNSQKKLKGPVSSSNLIAQENS